MLPWGAHEIRYDLAESKPELIIGIPLDKVSGIDLARKREKLQSLTGDHLQELASSHGFKIITAPGDIIALPSKYLYYTFSGGADFFRWTMSGKTTEDLGSSLDNVSSILETFPTMKSTAYGAWRDALALQVCD